MQDSKRDNTILDQQKNFYSLPKITLFHHCVFRSLHDFDSRADVLRSNSLRPPLHSLIMAQTLLYNTCVKVKMFPLHTFFIKTFLLQMSYQRLEK